MFELRYDNFSFDSDLQIVQADVRLSIDGETVIDEPMCVDVGLPALLLSCLRDTTPYRWAPADQWERMPFFVCGCGDPECRAYSFRVRHVHPDRLEWTAVDESEDGTYREYESYTIPTAVYRKQVRPIGERFLRFVDGLDYRPYFAGTVPVVRRLMEEIPGGDG